MSLEQEFAQLKNLAPALQDVHLVTSVSWASDRPQYRLLLRQAIQSQLKVKEDSMLNLEKLPELPNGFVSISHSQKVGGYVFSQKNKVGLDIESAARVSNKIVQRVSSDDELKLAPGPSHLWCAKEALFKSLRGDHQPQIISAVQFSQWNSLGHFWQAHSTLGISFVWNNTELDLTIAIALPAL